MQQYQFFACQVVWLGKGILCTSKHNYGTSVSRPGLIEQCFPFPLILLSMRSSSRSDCASDHCRCICVHTACLFFGIRVSLFSWVLSCVSCHAHNRVAGLKSASVLGVCAPPYGMGSPLILVPVCSLPNVTPSAPSRCREVVPDPPGSASAPCSEPHEVCTVIPRRTFHQTHTHTPLASCLPEVFS